MSMYTTELDLHLTFSPPMDPKAPGIIVTRRIELPFVPYDGVRVYSRAWDDHPEPDGLQLDNVVWDMDRGLFIAACEREYSGWPIAVFPTIIRSFIAMGWRFGSAVDWYEENPHDGEPIDDWLPMVESEVQERLHQIPADDRPRPFNLFWKALIRQMSDSYNNRAIAYAMDNTGILAIEGSDESEEAKRWRQYRSAFEQKSIQEQMAWEEKVRAYPRIREVLSASPKELKKMKLPVTQPDPLPELKPRQFV